MESDRVSLEYTIPELLSREHSLEDLMKMNPPDDAVLRRGSLLESVHCSDSRRMSELDRINEIMIKYENKRKKWKRLRSIFCLN